MKTPISYYGGKQMLLKHILPLIPEHSLYTEAFCGGCAVLFAKEPVRCEVINDTNTELVNFYRVAQMKYTALKELIDATLHSREIHAHARHINAHPTFFTSVERAWAVWVCTKLGFASMIDGTFGYDRRGPRRRNSAMPAKPSPRSCAGGWNMLLSSAKTAFISSGATIRPKPSILSIRPMWAATAATTTDRSTRRISCGCWRHLPPCAASSC